METALSTALNPFNVAPNLNEATVLQGPEPEAPTPLNPTLLTPPPTVKTPSPLPSPPKRKRNGLHLNFVNYLDDDESTQKRRPRRLKSQSRPHKYANQEDKKFKISKQ